MRYKKLITCWVKKCVKKLNASCLSSRFLPQNNGLPPLLPENAWQEEGELQPQVSPAPPADFGTQLGKLGSCFPLADE